jgi:hypothetical protein
MFLAGLAASALADMVGSALSSSPSSKSAPGGFPDPNATGTNTSGPTTPGSAAVTGGPLHPNVHAALLHAQAQLGKA